MCSRLPRESFSTSFPPTYGYVLAAFPRVVLHFLPPYLWLCARGFPASRSPLPFPPTYGYVLAATLRVALIFFHNPIRIQRISFLSRTFAEKMCILLKIF